MPSTATLTPFTRKLGRSTSSASKSGAVKTSDAKPQKAKVVVKLPEATKAEPRFYKRIKLSAETLKTLLEKEYNDDSDKIKKLKDMLAARTKDGRKFSLKDWRVYAAIDEAYSAPFNQITPTLIGKILSGSQKMTAQEILKELERWGLSESTLFTQIEDPKDSSKHIKILNRETFHKVLIPIVKSYINAREAKLFNERDNSPFLSYSLNQQTAEHKVIGDVITQIVDGITTGYGLKAVLRTAIHQALKYSFAMLFPVEAWHCEKDIDENGEEYTRKEGMRWNAPHPTRTAWDQSYPARTFNTDTGCEWGLYWRLSNFGAVDGNENYFNKDKVTYGSCWFGGDYQTYFEQVYPCTVTWPMPLNVNEWSSNREKEATRYASADTDKCVFLTDLFCKLSPKQWGLGEINHKIWFRFVMANDSTIVYAEPLPYSPILYLGSDADDSTSNRTASFGLECVPWQDLTGNILSQHLLSVKQNLIKIIPYDKYQVNESRIREIEAKGKESVSIVWLPFDSRDARVAQLDPSKMFNPVMLPQVNTAEIINTLVQVFNIMERALGISAQEVGGVGGHIQTAEEIRTVSENTSSRVQYLGTFVDEFIDAWKRQIMDGVQNFMDEDFVVYVNAVEKTVVEKMRKTYSFTFGDPVDGRVEIKGNKTKLSSDCFLSTREGKTRLNQPQIAQVLMQTVQAVAGNPELSAKVGAEQILNLLNRAAILAGAPDDAGLKITPEATAVAELKQLQAAIAQFAKQIEASATQTATQQASEQVTGTIIKQVAPAIQKTQQEAEAATQGVQQVAEQSGQQFQEMAQQLQQLQNIVLKINDFITAASQPPPPEPGMPINGPVADPAAMPMAPAGMM